MRLPVERAAKTVSVMKVWESSSNISNKYPYSTFRTFMGPWILPFCDPPYLGSWTSWDKVLYTRRCRIERATFLCYCTICWIYLSRVMQHIILACTCIFSLFWHNVPLNSALWDEIPQNNTDSDAPRLGYFTYVGVTQFHLHKEKKRKNSFSAYLFLGPKIRMPRISTFCGTWNIFYCILPRKSIFIYTLGQVSDVSEDVVFFVVEIPRNHPTML